MTTDYTPTTEEVFQSWKAGVEEWEGVCDRAEFYRWLAAHDAEVRADEYQRGYQRGCEDTARAIEDMPPFTTEPDAPSTLSHLWLVRRRDAIAAARGDGEHKPFDDCWEGGSIALCAGCSASGERVEWPCDAARGNGPTD